LILSIILLFDIFWIFVVWANWWKENEENGIIWRRLRRLHALSICLTVLGIGLKIIAIFSLFKSKEDLTTGENEPLGVHDFE
jgi:hypothetical protein